MTEIEASFTHSEEFLAIGISATTVGTGGDWSPKLLGWGTNNVLVPNFLAVVFKKQEISQQVLLLLSETQSFHINYSALRRHFSRYSTSD